MFTIAFWGFLNLKYRPSPDSCLHCNTWIWAPCQRPHCLSVLAERSCSKIVYTHKVNCHREVRQENYYLRAVLLKLQSAHIRNHHSEILFMCRLGFGTERPEIWGFSWTSGWCHCYWSVNHTLNNKVFDFCWAHCWDVKICYSTSE